MVTYLAALTVSYVDSAVTTSFTAQPDVYYVIDTATAGVTVTLPTGTAIGHSIVIANAPANGPQRGGVVAGNNLTIDPGAGETIEGNASDTLGPPTSTVTAATRQYFPTGANSGSGAGQAGFTGWMH